MALAPSNMSQRRWVIPRWVLQEQCTRLLGTMVTISSLSRYFSSSVSACCCSHSEILLHHFQDGFFFLLITRKKSCSGMEEPRFITGRGSREDTRPNSSIFAGICMAALTQPEGFLRYHELLWHLHLFLSYPKLVPCFHPPFAHPACTPCYHHKGPAVVFTLRTTTPKANSCHHGVHGNEQSQKTSRVGVFFVFFFEGTTTRG